MKLPPRQYAATFRRRPLSGRQPHEPNEVRIVAEAHSRKKAEAIAWGKLIAEHRYPRTFWYVVRIQLVNDDKQRL